MICLLEHNNIYFHKQSNNSNYQQIAILVYDLVENKKFLLSDELKFRYYSVIKRVAQ